MALPIPRLAPVMNKVRPASLLCVMEEGGGKGGRGKERGSSLCLIAGDNPVRDITLQAVFATLPVHLMNSNYNQSVKSAALTLCSASRPLSRPAPFSNLPRTQLVH